MEDGTIGILDLGTEEQKKKLYRIEELVPAPAGAVEMNPTDLTQWEVYDIRNQDGSNSCVYQARAKAAGILRKQSTGKFVVYSAADYNKRSNRPAEGSYPVEAFDYWCNQGIGLEHFEPSQNINDQELEQTVQGTFEADIAKVSCIEKFVGLVPYNFDVLIATLHATGKPVPVGFFAKSKEWKKAVPSIDDPNLTLAQASWRHEVCATPNFGIYQGQEGFTIEDSSSVDTTLDGTGVRWITREFFEKRNYIPGLYPTKFKTYNDIGFPLKPRVNLTIDLEFGMNHPDVKKLQDVYKYEGLFPANHEGSTLFHNITLDCTKKFQVRYNIAGPGEPGYGRVGPRTRLIINQKYA